MSDDDFLAALESCRLPAADFTHAAHVRAGFLYLKRHDYAEALGAMRRTIMAFAASIGKAELYHETITVAFMTLINERMASMVEAADWPSFEGQNGDLITGQPLAAHYTPERLANPLARRVFLLPDRGTSTQRVA
ncbi:hypothetical protein [Dongia mobilis]|jgi:hypothetical protein|uniref:hypothetical protein n=1 Tax=Dongia sp. TaxID=1977262 RepID=UPI0026F0C3F4